MTSFSRAGAYKLAVGALDFDSTGAAAAAHQPGRDRGASVDGRFVRKHYSKKCSTMSPTCRHDYSRHSTFHEGSGDTRCFDMQRSYSTTVASTSRHWRLLNAHCWIAKRTPRLQPRECSRVAPWQSLGGRGRPAVNHSSNSCSGASAQPTTALCVAHGLLPGAFENRSPTNDSRLRSQLNSCAGQIYMAITTIRYTRVQRVQTLLAKTMVTHAHGVTGGHYQYAPVVAEPCYSCSQLHGVTVVGSNV